MLITVFSQMVPRQGYLKEKKRQSEASLHLGIPFAHFFEMALAAPKVVAFWSSGKLFQTLAMRLEARVG